MIESAQEFVRLRTSDIKAEYDRATTEEAPVSVWIELVTKFPEMKEWVVRNKTVPLEILEILSGDSEAQIRAEVARKRKLSHALLEKLAKDTDASVRHAIACNAKTPKAILQQMVNDSWDNVSNVASERLKEM